MRILDGGIRAWKEARYPMKVGDSGIWTALFPACTCSDGPHNHTEEKLAGRLDHNSAGILRSRLNGLVKKGAHVTLSLSDVSYLDTAGIAVLVEASRWAKERSACLSLGEMSDAVRSSLQVARLGQFFPPA